MTKFFQRKTEAQASFEEVYPFPVVALAVVGLLAGNVALTIAAVAALG